jgi:signal transduction histidine kinase
MGRSQSASLGPRWSSPQALVDAIRQSERQAMARELHDTVIQPLAALITSIECLHYQQITPELCESYLGVWNELAREAMDSLRGALAGLSQHPHAELGLPEALRCYLAPQLNSHGLRMTLDVTNWPDDLPLDITTGLYLAVREALTNVERHAHASLVRVSLRANARALGVIISDDGIGFAEEALARIPRAAGSGFGIEGMRARVHALGGKLALFTAPGQGVRIEIRVPYCQQVSAADRSAALACAGG